MTKSRKRPFMCLAIDTTEDKEVIVVESQMILAIDAADAKQKFTIQNSEALGPVIENVEICVTPFCS